MNILPKNSSVGICNFCGNKFEQELKSDGKYANHRLCPNCRKTKDNSNKPSVSVVNYSPFEWQKEAEELLENHRIMVLACGARTGKDRFSIMMLIKYVGCFINENRNIHNPDLTPSFRVWVIAPTLGMANQNFCELKRFLPKSWIKKVKEAEMSFELLTGGYIEVKSAYDEESLVGVALDFCVITEADRIKNLEGVWANIAMRLISPGTGRDIDRQGRKSGCGKCIINSSPTKKGYFYQMYKWGQPDDDEYDADFISINLPSYANPYVKEELERIKHTKYGDITQFEDLKRKFSPERFARDVLGQFIDGTGTVFNEFKQKCVVDIFAETKNLSEESRKKFIKNWQEPIPGVIYRIGYDPATGSSADDPAIVVRNMSSNQIVFVESLYGKNYDQQWDEIAYVSRRYNYASCCWLRTGHTPVENQLAKRGVQEIPLNEQGGHKADYVQSLARAVQNCDIQVLDTGDKANTKLIKQMSDYTEEDGKYSNSSEAHDDFVSAMYAVYYDYSEETAETSFFCGLIGEF